jgi:hemolysin III
MVPAPARSEATGDARPLLRGVLHQAAAWYTLGAGSVLVAVCPDGRAAVAVGVYVLSLVALFAASAVYHRVQWKDPSARALMRRIDHASIFVLIAGTYTPVALLGVGGDAGTRLLLQVWGVALASAILSLVWAKAPKPLLALLAVAVGWSIVPHGSEVMRLLGPLIWLVLAGGIAYTLGALVYALRRPDPWPRVFGYHEVFHALTLLGALLHLVAIVRIVSP